MLAIPRRFFLAMWVTATSNAKSTHQAITNLHCIAINTKPIMQLKKKKQ